MARPFCVLIALEDSHRALKSVLFFRYMNHHGLTCEICSVTCCRYIFGSRPINPSKPWNIAQQKFFPHVCLNLDKQIFWVHCQLGLEGLRMVPSNPSRSVGTYHAFFIFIFVVVIVVCSQRLGENSLCLRSSYSYNRPWRPIGSWDVEAFTFCGQSAHRWRWGCQLYAPAGRLLSPTKIPFTHFS
jgi:hypothetical protein